MFPRLLLQVDDGRLRVHVQVDLADCVHLVTLILPVLGAALVRDLVQLQIEDLALVVARRRERSRIVHGARQATLGGLARVPSRVSLASQVASAIAQVDALRDQGGGCVPVTRLGLALLLVTSEPGGALDDELNVGFPARHSADAWSFVFDFLLRHFLRLHQECIFLFRGNLGQPRSVGRQLKGGPGVGQFLPLEVLHLLEVLVQLLIFLDLEFLGLEEVAVFDGIENAQALDVQSLQVVRLLDQSPDLLRVHGFLQLGDDQPLLRADGGVLGFVAR